MQTSARNQLKGTVRRIQHGAVNSEVVLDIGQGEELVAIVSKESAQHLGLVEGKSAQALIKASWPILAAGPMPRTSARNHLAGTVTALHEGAVNTEVVLKLTGGAEFIVMITSGSEHGLGIRVGDAVHALVKASHVILAVD